MTDEEQRRNIDRAAVSAGFDLLMSEISAIVRSRPRTEEDLVACMSHSFGGEQLGRRYALTILNAIHPRGES